MSGTGSKAEGAGFNTGATWGTEVALGTDDGLKLTADAISGGEEALVVDEIGDTEGQLPERGNTKWEGSISLPARYGGNVGRLIAHALGGSDTVDDHAAAGDVAEHTVPWAPTLAKFFTYCSGRNATELWRAYPSAMIEELVLEWTDGGRVSVSAKIVANRRLNVSTTNPRAVTNLVTVPAGLRQIMGADAVLRINAQAGGALAAPTDVVAVKAGKLTFRRKLSRDFLTSGGGYLAQPCEVGPSEVMLDLSFARYTATQVAQIDEWTNGDEKKADLVFSSGLSGYTAAPRLEFQLPRLGLNTRPQDTLPGSGTIPFDVSYKCTPPPAGAAPTGMDAAATTAVLMICEDNRLTGYFA